MTRLVCLGWSVRQSEIVSGAQKAFRVSLCHPAASARSCRSPAPDHTQCASPNTPNHSQGVNCEPIPTTAACKMQSQCRALSLGAACSPASAQRAARSPLLQKCRPQQARAKPTCYSRTAHSLRFPAACLTLFL